MLHITDQSQASIWLASIFKKFGGDIVDCKMSEKIDYKSIKTGDIIELRGADNRDMGRGRAYIAAGNWNSDGYCVLMSLSGSRLAVSGKLLHNMDIKRIGSIEA
jgi:hypothetical protein